MNKQIIDLIESYLESMTFGRVIIAKKEKKLTIFVENHDKKLIIDLEK